jgi:hypothetical protein
MTFSRDEFGRLLLDGEAVTPVRAHPISAPDEGISLIGDDGHERLWIPQLSRLPAAERELVEAELLSREFHPVLQRLVAVSTFSTPSQWTVETDRGLLQFFLKSEEDIRRIGDRGRLVISSSHGLQLQVPDRWALDRASRRLLERFL